MSLSHAAFGLALSIYSLFVICRSQAVAGVVNYFHAAGGEIIAYAGFFGAWANLDVRAFAIKESLTD